MMTTKYKTGDYVQVIGLPSVRGNIDSVIPGRTGFGIDPAYEFNRYRICGRYFNEGSIALASRCEDPDCRGWFRDGETGEITRCDACAIFEDDAAARDAANEGIERINGFLPGDVVDVGPAYRQRDGAAREGERFTDGFEGTWTITEITADGRDAKALRGRWPTGIANQCRIDDEYDAFIPLARCATLDRIF